MTVEDVYAMLALLKGLLEVHAASACKAINEYTKLLKQWRTRWNLRRRGTAKVGKIVEKFLEKEDHGDEFEGDLVLRIILTCIIRSMNGYYFFRILMLLIDVNQIPYYN